jgi:HK97 family phage major capsid protein
MDTAALREEFNKAQTEAQAIISAASKANLDLTAEEQQSNDRRFTRMEQIKKQFDQAAKFAKLSLDNGTAITPKKPEGQEEFDASEGRKAFAGADGKFDLEAYRTAMCQYVRTGQGPRQLFTTTTTTQSGAFLPKQVLQPIAVRRLQNVFRAVLAAAGMQPIETDSLAAFSLPVEDDTANVGQTVSESATSGTALDPAETGAISISPTLWDSKARWFSNTMLRAQAFDVLGYALPMLLKRIDKIQESAWSASIIAGANAGKTLASPTAITYAELLDWEHSLAAAYRTDAAFIVSDSLYRGLRGLTDDVHKPILDQDPTNVFAGKIHGRPVIVADYFQTLAANHTCGAFLSADAIKIIDVMDARLLVYVNYPEKPDQTGLQVFQNGDFGYVGNGVSLLKSAVS